MTKTTNQEHQHLKGINTGGILYRSAELRVPLPNELVCNEATSDVSG